MSRICATKLADIHIEPRAKPDPQKWTPEHEEFFYVSDNLYRRVTQWVENRLNPTTKTIYAIRQHTGTCLSFSDTDNMTPAFGVRISAEKD